MDLIAQDLAVALGGRRVLEGVAATLRPGRVTAILGPNGAGKSSLLRALAGLIAPAAGRVTIGGRDVAIGGGDVGPGGAVVVGALDDWGSVAALSGCCAPHGAGADREEALGGIGRGGFVGGGDRRRGRGR